jgi:hypothetical protein
MDREELIGELSDVAVALNSLSRLVRAETATCCKESDCLTGLAVLQEALAAKVEMIAERVDNGEEVK